MNKRGITELVQSELIKLVIVAMIAGLLVFSINTSTSGETTQLNLKAKEYALWVDAALNSDDNAKISLELPKNVENFEITVGDKLEIKKKNLATGISYRIIQNLNKNYVGKNLERILEINVE